MKLFYYFIIVFISNNVFANGDLNCSNGGHPKININVYQTALKQDYIHSKEIESRLSNKNLSAASHALGSFMSNVKWDVKAEYSYFEYSNKNVCANTINIGITVEYKPVIYLAKELMGASCPTSEVLLHEMEHYNIDKRGLDVSLRGIKDTVNGHLVGQKKFVDKNEMLKFYKNISSLVSSDIGLMFKNNTENAQKALDSQSEYERISGSCNGQFKGVMDKVIANKYFR